MHRPAKGGRLVRRRSPDQQVVRVLIKSILSARMTRDATQPCSPEFWAADQRLQASVNLLVDYHRSGATPPDLVAMDEWPTDD